MRVISTDNSRRRTFQIDECVFLTDDGWGYSDHIVDHTSGLVLIRVNTIEPVVTDAGKRFGWSSHPCRHFVFDPEAKCLLCHDEWRSRFSYDLRIKTSPDGRLECRMQRRYCPEQGIDEIAQELIDTIDHKVLISSSPIAFRPNPLPCLIDEWYQSRSDDQKKAHEELSKRTLEQDYALELTTLKPEDILLDARQERGTFLRVVRRQEQFWVYLENDGTEESIDQARNLLFKKSKIEHVFRWFARKSDWYKKWAPSQRAGTLDNYLLRSFFVREFNDMRFKHSFAAMDYGHIQRWERYFRDGPELRCSEYRQFCPLCKGYHLFFSRYPKSLCHTCRNKEIVDEDGEVVTYERMEEDLFPPSEDHQRLGKLYIDQQRVWFEEARFGGIVVQLGDEGRGWPFLF